MQFKTSDIINHNDCWGNQCETLVKCQSCGGDGIGNGMWGDGQCSNCQGQREVCPASNKTSAEVPAYQAIDVLLGKPWRDKAAPVPGFALCNASPIFEGGTKCVVLDEGEDVLTRLNAEVAHLSRWPSNVRPCWIHTEQDFRKCQTPR